MSPSTGCAAALKSHLQWRLWAGRAVKGDRNLQLCKWRYLRVADLGAWRSMGALNLSREWPLSCLLQDALAGAANSHFPPNYMRAFDWMVARVASVVGLAAVNRSGAEIQSAAAQVENWVLHSRKAALSPLYQFTASRLMSVVTPEEKTFNDQLGFERGLWKQETTTFAGVPKRSVCGTPCKVSCADEAENRQVSRMFIDWVVSNESAVLLQDQNFIANLCDSEHDCASFRGIPMDREKRILSLTSAQVALVHRVIEDAGPPVGQQTQTDHDYAEWVSRMVASNSAPNKPTQLFAYGSLIWKPEIEHVGERSGVLHGWHRSFCLRQLRFRATPENPGLMMSLDQGGECQGVLFELPEEDLETQLDRLFRREFTVKPNTNMPLWVTVDTDSGPVEALAFVMSRTSELYAGDIPLEEIADVLARSCGHLGTGAEYLLKTVTQLEARGLHDHGLWRLQELVSERIGPV